MKQKDISNQSHRIKQGEFMFETFNFPVFKNTASRTIKFRLVI